MTMLLFTLILLVCSGIGALVVGWVVVVFAEQNGYELQLPDGTPIF